MSLRHKGQAISLTKQYLIQTTKFRQHITLMSTALLIFQISIRSPTKQLIMITVLVSLSITYRRTTTDWKTLKNTDRTDKPSRVFRLRQNCMSKKTTQVSTPRNSNADCTLFMAWNNEWCFLIIFISSTPRQTCDYMHEDFRMHYKVSP